MQNECNVQPKIETQFCLYKIFKINEDGLHHSNIPHGLENPTNGSSAICYFLHDYATATKHLLLWHYSLM
jgi:hypothetical protein